MRTTLKTTLILALLAAFGLCSALAHAGGTTAGTVYLEPKVGMYANSSKNISSMFSYGAEAGYFFVDGFALGLEGLGYSVTQKRYPTTAVNTYENVGAFSPIAWARYHFISDEKVSVFAGLGLGGFFSGVNVPRNGFTSNMTEAAEVGFNVYLVNALSMQLAGRYQHIGEFSDKGSDNWGGNLALKYGF
ncbi:outer membrane beta-barrel protein [Fundidesulfovibrio soli]|uniref:outer membrane beta-barrel protein n=1 Tax=Fundidesulfovibrio soli TaxID=2922716 RepID=UPI001FAEB1CE|nr:outer membrane beta-barrel protein [Fundidesulfovibrio soli]